MNIYYLGDALQKNGQVADLLKHFFVNDNGFVYANLIALFVAFFGALIFYLGMGRKFRLSTMKMWVTMLILSCLISFGLTAFSTGTITGEKSNIGIAKTFKKMKDGTCKCKICAKYKNKEEKEEFEKTIKGSAAAKRAQSQKKDSKGKIKNPNYLTFNGNSVAQCVSFVNILWTLLLFLVFSMVFKLPKLRITKFANYIPCRWPNGKE